jgi:protein ImuB
MEIACVIVPEAALRAVVEDRGSSSEDVWEDELRRLEGIGAALESERAGEAFFAIDGLKGIHGGERSGVLEAARRAAAMPVRIGVAPTRFAAFAAASRLASPASDGEQVVAEGGLRAFLDPLPVASLSSRLDLGEREEETFVEALRRLGIGTLGALAALAPARVADRFGPPGLRAHGLARGEEPPLRTRRPHVELAAEIELPEGTAGGLLERALELLVDRFLAAPQRRGRTVLALRFGATLGDDGGSWSVEQGLGRPTASARSLRTVLAPRLEALPAPASVLRLRAIALGPPVGDQIELSVRGSEERRHRLASAVREVRSAQGAEALLKVLPVDPASRIPERRAVLTPFRP